MPEPSPDRALDPIERAVLLLADAVGHGEALRRLSDGPAASAACCESYAAGWAAHAAERAAADRRADLLGRLRALQAQLDSAIVFSRRDIDTQAQLASIRRDLAALIADLLTPEDRTPEAVTWDLPPVGARYRYVPTGTIYRVCSVERSTLTLESETTGGRRTVTPFDLDEDLAGRPRKYVPIPADPNP